MTITQWKKHAVFLEQNLWRGFAFNGHNSKELFTVQYYLLKFSIFKKRCLGSSFTYFLQYIKGWVKILTLISSIPWVKIRDRRISKGLEINPVAVEHVKWDRTFNKFPVLVPIMWSECGLSNQILTYLFLLVLKKKLIQT